MARVSRRRCSSNALFARLETLTAEARAAAAPISIHRKTRGYQAFRGDQAQNADNAVAVARVVGFT
jgi:hypothetical protein